MTSLSHHIDIDFLHEAYRRTRKDGAPGVDEMTAEEYAKDLDANLRSLLERFKSGTYWAPPVRRVHIPKGDGTRTRPIGIPTFEDKVLQRAVAMIVEAVYEQEFYNCSWGFRPNRSAHQALEELREGLMKMKGGWVVEVDLESFFDTLDHGRLRQMLDRRVRDGVVRRTIDKWLKAGVLEDVTLTRSELGTPQGGVISPLLANIYLHEVLDRWFKHAVKPSLGGESFLIRFADDFVIVCANRSDSETVMKVLPERFAQFGLKLHPVKTRLVDFQRPSRGSNSKGPGQGPGSFDLLGFTHYWRRSRRGAWVIGRKTATTRLVRSLRKVTEWCRRNRHLKVAEQWKELVSKIRGHNQYFGITGNVRSLLLFLRKVERIWYEWLNRRSQRNNMPWDRFKRLLWRYPLPEPVVVHSVYRLQRSRAPKSRMR